MNSNHSYILCLLFVAIFALAAERQLCAQQQQCDITLGTPRQYDIVEVRDILPQGVPGAGTLANFEVRIDLPVNQGGAWTDYANGVDCGGVAHRTRNDPPNASNPPDPHDRYFAHCRVNYAFPVSGTIVGTNNIRFTVTESNVRVYWDNYYKVAVVNPTPIVVYSGGAGVTPKSNCWAYAFGYDDIWIQDPTRIYNNDYGIDLRTDVGHVIRQPGYAIKAASVLPSGFVFGSIEKNRSSGIYTGTWYYSSATTTGVPYKKKP